MAPVTSNAIFGAETPFIGLDSEEGCYSTDYSTVMRTLGPAQKAPRFYLKGHLAPNIGMSAWGNGVKPARPERDLSGFYNRPMELW